MAKNNTKTVKKHTGGRPTVMTPETLRILRGLFLMDLTDEEACLSANISPSALYAYQKIHPEFTEQKRAWRLNPFLKSKITVFNNLGQLGAAQWYLERRDPEHWGNRSKIEITNPEDQKKMDNLTIIIKKLSIDAKREIIKADKRSAQRLQN